MFNAPLRRGCVEKVADQDNAATTVSGSAAGGQPGRGVGVGLGIDQSLDAEGGCLTQRATAAREQLDGAGNITCQTPQWKPSSPIA